MSSADHPAEPTLPASSAEDEAYYRATLREMSERGMNLLRQADAAAALSLTERADIFERVSRAVRRTILLERHIIAQRTCAAPAHAPSPPRPAADAEIARANRTEPPDRPERGEQRERVETIDREPALFARPIPEIIAAIEQDLRPLHPPRPMRPANDRPAHPQFQPPYRGPPARLPKVATDLTPRQTVGWVSEAPPTTPGPTVAEIRPLIPPDQPLRVSTSCNAPSRHDVRWVSEAPPTNPNRVCEPHLVGAPGGGARRRRS